VKRIRTIAARFALLLALAAVFPLVLYGAVSILSLQRGTRESVIQGHANVASRAAEEIRRYISTNARVLRALAADLQDTELQTWQQDRILKSYVLDFREFREVTLFTEDGGIVATSRVGRPSVGIPSERDRAVMLEGVSMSPISIDADQLPTTVFAVHLMHLNQPSGWLVAEFRLEEMWRMVDQIRLGEQGYAMVLAPDGALVAHGDPDKKALVAESTNMRDHPLFGGGVPDAEYTDADGRRTLAVAAAIPTLGWTVVVEQPTSEAFATAAELRRQLLVAIAAGLLVMISAGYVFGRRYMINPIRKLQRGTTSIAAGDLSTRVTIDSRDEFGELGASFNTMADRLVELQEDVKRQERHAMFGRVAAGLVHDLSHPIQNIGNSTRLLLRDDLDAESRDLFRRTIERELETLRRFMDDLRNIVKPKPIERFAMDVNQSVAEIVDPMKAEGTRNGITVETQYAAGPLVIEGDRFALGRVYRNLVTNAIQATEAGGTVHVETARDGGHVVVRVGDTGTGIAPDRLGAIFDDFVTTKRRGLGLGLAISKRIVEQLDGTITVESELGKGTVFTMRFPARDDRAAQAAAS
jgi:signal transduction histidine kinase